MVITRRASGIDRPIVPTIRLGEMEIDIPNRDATGTSVVHLTSIEQALLYLRRAAGDATRDEILDGVWGADFVAESNIVDRHIRGRGSSSRTITGTPGSLQPCPAGAIDSSRRTQIEGGPGAATSRSTYPTEPVMTARHDGHRNTFRVSVCLR